jgi:hypothetical protein
LAAVVRQQLVAPAIPAAIGTTPPNFNPNLPNYHHIDILNLIIFYNDDFGIVPGDSLGTRIDKFHAFIAEF